VVSLPVQGAIARSGARLFAAPAEPSERARETGRLALSLIVSWLATVTLFALAAEPLAAGCDHSA
jgi:hypothetical protein